MVDVKNPHMEGQAGRVDLPLHLGETVAKDRAIQPRQEPDRRLEDLPRVNERRIQDAGRDGHIEERAEALPRPINRFAQRPGVRIVVHHRPDAA